MYIYVCVCVPIYILYSIYSRGMSINLIKNITPTYTHQ